MYIDPVDVFSKAEEDRKANKLSKKATRSTLRYQSSKHTDYIEQINTDTGECTIGIFLDGEFIEIISTD